MDELRLLSLWEPWASLIPSGLKQIETRSRSTSYRGKVAIQASLRRAKDDEVVAIYENLKTFGGTTDDVAKLDQVLGQFLMWHDTFTYGAIVSIVDLVDCHQMWNSQVYGPLMPPHRRGIDIASLSPLEKAVGDWQEGRFAWMLNNVRALAPPITCKGSQGLSRIRDESVLSGIKQQLAA